MIAGSAGKLASLAALCWSAATAQTLDSKALNGKYFFRHVSLVTDASGAITDARSLIGAITFDGNGGYSFTGQQTQGASAVAARTGSGKYSMDPGGTLSLDNPIRSASINARFSAEAVLGSSTETAATETTFDLFAAIPAGAPTVFSGTYWTVSLEFPDGSAQQARNSLFSLAPVAQGRFADIAVSGHAANSSGGRPSTQTVTGATWSLAADGTGSAAFGNASPTALLGGNRTFYVSRSGNILIGGSTAPGAHDLMIGVKAVTGASNATWNATFWTAGLRFSAGDVTSYSGSAAARGAGKVVWSRRLKVLGFGNLDFTGANSYNLKPDGSGVAELTQVALGAGGRAFVGSAIDPLDPDAYEIFLGVQVPDLSGSGVFLNPLGVTSAASFAPPGTPISAGQFIALYGTGLAASSATARIPYPLTLNNVTVLVNDRPAPLYFVSPGQINALVPFATVPGKATIVVQNGAARSNPVQVLVARTAPGVYSLNQNGVGAGAILHADFSLVNDAKPAVPGETVLIYLTGMGAVNPAVADGAVPGSNPLRNVASLVTVLVAGRPGSVLFNGLSPQYPGLYQINVTLPGSLPPGPAMPLAIQTPDSFHDQVDIAIAP